MKNTFDILTSAAATYTERNKVYGDNYKQFGAALLACFGGEIHITTVEEANRLGVFIQCLSKLTRYGHSFKGGHVDSAHDLIVYAAILEELTK